MLIFTFYNQCASILPNTFSMTWTIILRSHILSLSSKCRGVELTCSSRARFEHVKNRSSVVNGGWWQFEDVPCSRGTGPASGRARMTCACGIPHLLLHRNLHAECNIMQLVYTTLIINWTVLPYLLTVVYKAMMDLLAMIHNNTAAHSFIVYHQVKPLNRFPLCPIPSPTS